MKHCVVFLGFVLFLAYGFDLDVFSDVDNEKFILDSDIIEPSGDTTKSGTSAVANTTKEGMILKQIIFKKSFNSEALGWPPYRRRSLLKKKKPDNKCNNDSLRKILKEVLVKYH